MKATRSTRSTADVRAELERKARVLNIVSVLALFFIFVMAIAVAVAPGLGSDRLAVLALAVALVAFLVPTSEAHRRNAIEAADALDEIDGRSESALWLQVERRVPRLMPRLWPRDEIESTAGLPTTPRSDFPE